MKSRVVAFLLVVVAAPPVAPAAAADPLLRSVTPGSTLVLLQPIEIPADSASAYIQGGRVVSEAVLDQGDPHCILAVRDVLERPQRVMPDRFTVTRVIADEVEFVQAPPLLRWIAPARAEDGDGAPQYTFATWLYLSSSTQPQVRYLACGQESDYSIGEHISLAAFRAAVGSYFRLEPLGAAP